MSNEQYLIVSYFTIGLVAFLLALATYYLFRKSIMTLSDNFRSKLSVVIRRFFLIGIVLPALFGFFSVSFRSCSESNYTKIIADRSYLVAKNQEQLASALFYLVIALLIWGLIVAVMLIFTKNYTINKDG